VQKVEHLLGMSLDPQRLSLWTQVWRVVFMIGAKRRCSMASSSFFKLRRA
jgi:hypothetical protein